MTDAAEAVGQHVQEEAAQELLGIEGHDLGLVMMPVVFPAEAHPAVVKADEAVIGDGDAMGVAAEIVEDLLRPGERRLSILLVIRAPLSSFTIRIIRSMDKPPLSCARNIAMENAISV